MFKIVCTNCERENVFQSNNSVPVECSFCFEIINDNLPIIESNKEVSEIESLTIIYQNTQQRLEISTMHKVFLGRENFGADIFSKIIFNGKSVISRKHCSIEFKKGCFYLLDEGSLNGTFYGVNKLTCTNTPRVIEDNSIFYIGEEAFLAQINYKEIKFENKNDEKENHDTRIIKYYKCNESGCNFETQLFNKICPNCNTFNSLISIYE